jgi:hydrogenase maturation protease
MCDDGVGVHTVRCLEAGSGGRVSADGIEFLDAGTLSFTLTTRLEAAGALIVIDAARFDAVPGSVRVIEGEAMDAFLDRPRRLSAHDVSLVDLLRILRLTGTLPPRRALVGIEPASLGWGETPSEPVARAIPRAAAAVIELIERWRCAPVSVNVPAAGAPVKASVL